MDCGLENRDSLPGGNKKKKKTVAGVKEKKNLCYRISVAEGYLESVRNVTGSGLFWCLSPNAVFVFPVSCGRPGNQREEE